MHLGGEPFVCIRTVPCPSLPSLDGVWTLMHQTQVVVSCLCLEAVSSLRAVTVWPQEEVSTADGCEWIHRPGGQGRAQGGERRGACVGVPTLLGSVQLKGTVEVVGTCL